MTGHRAATSTHRGGSRPAGSAAAARSRAGGGPAVVHRAGTARRSRGRHAALPAARRPRRVHADLRIRLHPLGRPRCPEISSVSTTRPRRVMRGTCSGSATEPARCSSDGTMSALRQNTAHPGPLADPADPLGWHELDDPPEIAMRRARRIDVWDEDGVLGIDAMFRDSCWEPDGAEVVIHEYQMLGQADRADWKAHLRHRRARVCCPTSSAPAPLPTRRGWPAPTCGPCAPRSSQRLRADRLLHPSERRAALTGRGADPRGSAARTSRARARALMKGAQCRRR